MHYLEYIPVIWIVVTHLVLGNGLCYCALLLACYIVSVEQELYYRQHSMAWAMLIDSKNTDAEAMAVFRYKFKGYTS